MGVTKVAVKNDTWVLVAGTGRRSGVPRNVCLVAAAVGAALARYGCGLVTGGWPGVDYIASEAFASVELQKRVQLEHRLVQVVPNDMTVEFPGGRVVGINPGPLEWIEPQSYCDAVVLIGGIGGTYGTFLSALHKGLPRFPLGGTGGDAATAFQNMCELWDAFPNPGVTKSDFESLGRKVATRKEAEDLADALLPLVIESINCRKGRTPRSVFISYSRHDVSWLHRIRAILQPVEQTGSAQIWTDIDIEAGSQWDKVLRRELSVCDIAILLVSTNFLQSDYVKNVELPILLDRARTERTLVLWIVLSRSPWDKTELPDTQAVCNPQVPLEDLNASDVQIALVALRQAVEKHLAHLFETITDSRTG